MPSIRIDLSGDHEAFGRSIGIDRLPVLHTTADWSIDALEHGMASGATSLMVAIPLEVEGRRLLVMAETSLNAWMMATSVLRAAHEDEVGEPGWAVLSPATRALLIPRYAEAIRRTLPDVDEARSLELAEMFIDGLAAGAPTEED